MPDPRQTNKRKKAQILQGFDRMRTYIIDILMSLEYDEEYIPVYVQVVTILKSLHEDDPSLSPVQHFERIKDIGETPDLGTRYKYLIDWLMLYLATEEWEQEVRRTII